ncbi:MAG: hypothetical protein IPH28_14070 [Cytophagaceae bacterium]|nr:hypothetical protein [Cytophagaceae bacterium]
MKASFLKDYYLFFFEYFHTQWPVSAAHQTGWTGVCGRFDSGSKLQHKISRFVS